MSSIFSLQYLGLDNDFNRELDKRLSEDNLLLSSQYGSRKPKGHDFEIRIYFKGTSRTGKPYSWVADHIFAANDLISKALEDFDFWRLNVINHYRLDPKRSYDRIDRSIHALAKDAIKHIQKFFSQRPIPGYSNAESTIKKKGFDQYGTDTGTMFRDKLAYEVKYIGSKTFR